MTLVIALAAAALAVGALWSAVRTAARVPRRNADFRWTE